MKVIFNAILSLGVTVTTAMSAPVTYDVDQAFWGTYSLLLPVTIDTWQAQQLADVQTNPGNYNRLSGQISLDFMGGTVSAIDLTVTYGFGALQESVAFDDGDLAAPVVFTSMPVDLITSAIPSDSFVFDFSKLFGPDQSFNSAGGGTETVPEHRASLAFTISKSQADGDFLLNLSAARFDTAVQGTKFVPTPGCTGGILTGGSPCVTLEPNGAQYSTTFANLPSQTYGGVGVAPTPVPLPAAAWLLTLGVAGLFGLRRL